MMIDFRSYSRFASTFITICSFILTTITITWAFRQKKQFYPSVIYITKSGTSMLILYLQGIVLLALFGKLTVKIFFGKLRSSEIEHLIERSWYAITETCLAFTVFRDDFSTRFVTMFAFLLFLKCFHWLSEDRIDYMERTPDISIKFHLRIISILLFLALGDALFIRNAIQTVLVRGASVQIVFGFEYTILALAVFGMLCHYVLHTIDSWHSTAWESKSTYLLYVDLLLHFDRLILYSSFLLLMLRLHTFPLFLIRPAYLSLRSFKKSLRDVILSRRAIRYLNTQFETVTVEMLRSMSAVHASSTDTVCIICRDDMLISAVHTAPQSGSAASEVIKRLPCQHIFHARCLSTWFQRQQTCPTCRSDILRAAHRQRSVRPDSSAPTPPSQPAAASARSSNQQHPIDSSSVETGRDLRTSGYPFSTAPPDLESSELARMSVDELRQLEGQHHAAVLARVQCLERIRLLLDAAMLQMNAYTQAVAVTRQSTSTVDVHEKSVEELLVKREESIASAAVFDDVSGEDHCIELQEIRKRRLEKFGQGPSTDNVSKQDIDKVAAVTEE